MLELFELSRFFSGSEFRQQEYGLLKKPEPFAPNSNFRVYEFGKYLLL